MKRYYILLATSLVIILCLNIDLQWKHQEQDNFDITMHNIEALANGENGTISCLHLGTIDCPTSVIKVKYLLQ